MIEGSEVAVRVMYLEEEEGRRGSQEEVEEEEADGRRG
jgi:hypothetical protein